MKKLIFCTLLTIFCVNGFAQRYLGIEDRSLDNAVFGGVGTEACVTIAAPIDLYPQFYVNRSLKAPAKIDTAETIVNYHLIFNVRTGDNTKTVKIQVDGFSPYTLGVFLTPKQQMDYFIYDPDVTIISCYYELTKEGGLLFRKAMYNEAKERYNHALKCSNIPAENNLSAKMAVIDSIQRLYILADAHFVVADYKAAADMYTQIYYYNPDDEYAKDRMRTAIESYNNDCFTYFNSAKSYHQEGEYYKALEQCKLVLSRSCRQSLEANQLLIEIQKFIDGKNQLSTVLTYDWSQNTAIGFSIGSYRDRKVGGYFSLRTNTDMFEALRSNDERSEKPEVNASFGWNFRPVKTIYTPFWLNLGIGYTGAGQYIYNLEDQTQKPDFNFYHAISPEIGVLVKIKFGRKVPIGIALKYTFQYRFAIDAKNQDYIGSTAHVFGAGLCF